MHDQRSHFINFARADRYSSEPTIQNKNIKLQPNIIHKIEREVNAPKQYKQIFHSFVLFCYREKLKTACSSCACKNGAAHIVKITKITSICHNRE